MSDKIKVQLVSDYLDESGEERIETFWVSKDTYYMTQVLRNHLEDMYTMLEKIAKIMEGNDE